ncbi:MAG: PAS domain S-box protein, partial [Candidatus Binatia bacterium]
MSTPLRLLMVDDSEADATLLLRALRAGGFKSTAHRVANAASLTAALDQAWELVLCDWSLPGFSGLAALELMHERGLDAPIIIVSSDLGEAGAVAAMRAGAHDFVSKHHLDRLLPAVERARREADGRRAQRAAEQALRASEERFTKAFEYAPIAMALVTIGGTILKVNRAMGTMFGYSEAEMMELPVWRITHPDDMPATFAQMERLVEGEIDTWFLEKRYFHRDGQLLWGRSTTWLVRDGDGVAQYVVSQVQDITESKRLLEEARRREGELAHALRVATIGETVAQVAHEINQPLASIANFAHGLVTRIDRGHSDFPAMRAAAAEIAAEALRASEVIRHLRELLRKGEPKLERCDANDVVRDAVRLIEPDLRAHAIDVALDLSPQPLPIEVDRVQVEQVVLNLLRNALDALIASPDASRRLTIDTARRDPREIAVQVHDTGVGLPPTAGSAIFDPFFTTKAGGLGLGLS